MRKSILSCFLLLSISFLKAERVDINMAQRVAENATSRIYHSNPSLRSATLQLAYTAFSEDKENSLKSSRQDVDYYVFNIGKETGFIIISGEDRTFPILGYSTEGTFDIATIPDNMKTWIGNYQKEITYVTKNNIEPSSLIQSLWKEYLTGALRLSTDGVLLKTAKWSQRKPYNLMCPVVGGHEVPTGCTATAMAIVMKYHEYPQKAIGGISSYYDIPITYDEYDWDSMLMEYGFYGTPSPTKMQNNAVAKLMWHCGANMEMEYNMDGSSSSTYLAPHCLVNVFGYANTICAIQKSQLTWNRWKQIIKAELQANRPVLYSGSNSRIGHAVVCDGYTKDGAFHINWGWGGSCNGYFLLSTMDSDGTGDGYAANPHIVIGIQPPTGNDIQANRIMSSDLECDDFPLHVGIPFNVRVDLINLITGEGESFNDYNGYLGLAIAGTDGAIQSVIGNYKFDIWHPYITGIIEKTLGTGEKIIVISKEKPTDDWHIVPPLLGTSPGLMMNGLLAAEEDILEEPAPYVRIDDSSGSFDIENISTGTLHRDIRSYSIYNNTGKLYFKYQLKDPQSWLPVMTMYYGKDYNKSFKTFNFDTSGEAWITSEDFKITENNISYSIWYEIFSTQEGSLAYEISIFDEYKDRCYGTYEYVIDFISQNASFDFPETIDGSVYKDIFFKIRVKDPGSYKDRPIIFSFRIPNAVSDKFSLDYIENGLSHPCKFTGNDLSNIIFEQELIPLPNTEYTFKLSSDNERISDFYMSVREVKNNKDIVNLKIATLNIKEAATHTEQINNTESYVWKTNGLIKIQTSRPENVRIFNINGKLYRTFYSTENIQQISLPKGIYLIIIGKQIFKIVN